MLDLLIANLQVTTFLSQRRSRREIADSREGVRMCAKLSRTELGHTLCPLCTGRPRKAGIAVSGPCACHRPKSYSGSCAYPQAERRAAPPAVTDARLTFRSAAGFGPRVAPALGPSR